MDTFEVNPFDLKPCKMDSISIIIYAINPLKTDTFYGDIFKPGSFKVELLDLRPSQINLLII